MSRTFAEEIVARHTVDWEGPRLPRPGDRVGLRPDRLMTHDKPSAVHSRLRAAGAAGFEADVVTAELGWGGREASQGRAVRKRAGPGDRRDRKVRDPRRLSGHFERRFSSYARARDPDSHAFRETQRAARDVGAVGRAARDVQRDRPDVTLISVNIDALMMALARRPEDHRVIVASNRFGEVVSDPAADLTGGLGFAWSANLGPEASIFEPTHGSAPKVLGLEPSLVNPIAAVVAEGRVVTVDMLRTAGGPEIAARGAAATRAMGEAITAGMRR